MPSRRFFMAGTSMVMISVGWPSVVLVAALLVMVTARHRGLALGYAEAR